MTRTKKIGIIIAAAVVVTAACLLLTSALGKHSSSANILSVKLFFPFFGLTYYLGSGYPIPSPFLLVPLVYLQFPAYAAVVGRGWLNNRLRGPLTCVAVLHIIGLLAVFGAGLYFNH